MLITRAEYVDADNGLVVQRQGLAQAADAASEVERGGLGGPSAADKIVDLVDERGESPAVACRKKLSRSQRPPARVGLERMAQSGSCSASYLERFRGADVAHRFGSGSCISRRMCRGTPDDTRMSVVSAFRRSAEVRLTASVKATACLAEALRAKAEAGHYGIR